jgi:hypothetical protein
MAQADWVDWALDRFGMRFLQVDVAKEFPGFIRFKFREIDVIWRLGATILLRAIRYFVRSQINIKQ